MLFHRVVVEEGEESLRREKNRVCELQQQLEQERAVSLRKVKEEEERRGVRINMNEILRTNTPAKRDLFYLAFWLHVQSSFKLLLCYKLLKMTVLF